MFLLALMLAFMSLGAAPPPKRLLLPADLEWVCTPYAHGRSCKPTAEVRAFILGNATDECSE